MKPLITALIIALCVSSASAWDYIPIEQSRSYNAYRGPVWGYPAYPRYYGRGYGGYAVPRPLPPIQYHEMHNFQTGQTWQGYSW
jgi:hypothetical protein